MREKSDKVQVNIRLDNKTIDYISSTTQGTTVSERVMNFINNKCNDLIVLENEEERLKLRLQQIERRKKENEFDIARRNKESNSWFEETLRVIEQHPEASIHRKNAYNNIFHMNITMEDFNKLLRLKKEELYGHHSNKQ